MTMILLTQLSLDGSDPVNTIVIVFLTSKFMIYKAINLVLEKRGERFLRKNDYYALPICFAPQRQNQQLVQQKQRVCKIDRYQNIYNKDHCRNTWCFCRIKARSRERVLFLALSFAGKRFVITPLNIV